MEMILNYLCGKYAPAAVILYGSYADGAAGEDSDFDALVLADHEMYHDEARHGKAFEGLLKRYFGK